MANPVTPYAVVADYGNISVGTEFPLKATGRGSLRTANTEPFQAALARSRFCFSPGVVANAYIPVVDVPTTTATMALYNAESAVGKSLFIETVWVHSASGTLGLGAALLVGLVQIAQAPTGTAPTANATGIVGPKRLGGGSASSSALFKDGVTLAQAPAWITVATVQQVAAVSIGAGMLAQLDGAIEVPPGFILGMAVLAPTGTTAKFGYGVTWVEYIAPTYV